jgi:gamma-glutamylputrescine oxidase
VTAAHAPSLYAAAADATLSFPPLAGETRADVAIIGGGYTGLSAALALAEAGVGVALVEAERVGWGASGRNGGQFHSGQRRDQDWLEAHLGRDEALRLWRLAEEAKAFTKGLIARHEIACDWRDGVIETVHKRRWVDSERAYVDKLRRDYGYGAVEWLDREALTTAIGTDTYFGGRRDMGAGHLDPLKLAQGLARAAAAAGARIFEGTKAIEVAGSATGGFSVHCRHFPPPRERGRSVGAAGRVGVMRQTGGTDASPADLRSSDPPLSGEGEGTTGTEGKGTIRADIVILAGDGYLAGIDSEVEARVVPIDNYIVATEPIGAGTPGGLIAGGEAISDTRFIVYYYRPTADGRLLFGGGETYSLQPPADIAGFVRGHLRRIYPQLADTRIDYAWGGTLSITLNRLPYIRRVRPGIYAACGYSGQGVALAPYAGKLLADAIRGDPAKLDVFAALPVPRFPGGRWLRYPLMVAGMNWYALRDRL